MDLKDILSSWEVDCRLDANKLDESSRITPTLHAKYLSLLSQAKLQLKQAEFKQKDLMKYKFLWYNGKMDRDTLERMGWEPDPFNGLKIMKGDMAYYVDSDPELVASEARIQLLTVIIDTLKEILDNLKWRHSTIKNMIDYKKYEAGF
jgi:hypothetical protein